MTIEGLGKKFQEARRARNLTLDGYSYLQENRPEKPVSAPVVPRRPATGGRDRISAMPLIVGIVVLVIGFSVMKLLLNVQRLAPGRAGSTAQASPSASPVAGSKALPPGPAASAPSNVASAPSVAPTAVAAGAPGEPEVRRAKPVTREDLAKPQEATNSPSAESGEQNRVAIRPLKRTYVRVTVGDEKGRPAFERWVSPADGTVEFRGKHVSIRVLDPDAVKITKNGKALEEGDQDVTVN